MFYRSQTFNGKRRERASFGQLTGGAFFEEEILGAAESHSSVAALVHTGPLTEITHLLSRRSHLT